MPTFLKQATSLRYRQMGYYSIFFFAEGGIQPDVLEWCEEQFGKGINFDFHESKCLWTWRKFAIMFKRKEDALHFMMTWL